MFVGTAASTRSAAVGAYYAHPGNRFWHTLFATGLTKRLFAPHEFVLLLKAGIGFTDVAKRAAGMDHQIPHAAFESSSLAMKLAAIRPRTVAFTSKRAASLYLGTPTKLIGYGLQLSTDASGAAMFVLPSPSGAARRSWSIEPWRELARFVG